MTKGYILFFAVCLLSVNLVHANQTALKWELVVKYSRNLDEKASLKKIGDSVSNVGAVATLEKIDKVDPPIETGEKRYTLSDSLKSKPLEFSLDKIGVDCTISNIINNMPELKLDPKISCVDIRSKLEIFQFIGDECIEKLGKDQAASVSFPDFKKESGGFASLSRNTFLCAALASECNNLINANATDL